MPAFAGMTFWDQSNPGSAFNAFNAFSILAAMIW